MADYSIWVLGESNLSFSGSTVLDGITQGDGSHLVGETMTINSTSQTEVFVKDGGSDTNFSDNDSNQRLDGTQVIDGVSYANNTRIEAEFEFIARDDATGIEYRVVAVNINNSSPAYGTNEAIAFVGTPPPVGVALTILSAQEGPPNSGGRAVDATDITPICLTEGTLIDTSEGPVAVENLRPGDTIINLDGAHVALRRVFRRRFIGADLGAAPNLRPVRIMAGSMGHGLPRRDLLVSRQHRMLVSSRITRRVLQETEVLVAAVKLTGLPGIFVDETVSEVTYFHLLFDRHEIVYAEGAPTESLYPGPDALKSVTPEARKEILTIFPEIADMDYRLQPARPIPTGKEQRLLVARHLKNGRSLLGAKPAQR
jgi:hypothetical protein